MPNEITYTSIASIILKEINKIRNDPQELIPTLENRKKKYDEEGNYYPLDGLNFSVRTQEGVEAIDRLIEFLREHRKCPSVAWSYELHQAAQKRCQYLSKDQQNSFDYEGRLDIGTLVSQFGRCKGHLVQLTFYGFIEPRQFICQLLLQDGRVKKDNRYQFFNHMSNFVGIGIETHQKFKFVVVLVFAMHVTEKSAINQHALRRFESDVGTDEETVVFCGQECTIY